MIYVYTSGEHSQKPEDAASCGVENSIHPSIRPSCIGILRNNLKIRSDTLRDKLRGLNFPQRVMPTNEAWSQFKKRFKKTIIPQVTTREQLIEIIETVEQTANETSPDNPEKLQLPRVCKFSPEQILDPSTPLCVMWTTPFLQAISRWYGRWLPNTLEGAVAHRCPIAVVTDATYRLNYHGFPVFVYGMRLLNNTLVPVALGLLGNEKGKTHLRALTDIRYADRQSWVVRDVNPLFFQERNVELPLFELSLSDMC